MNSTGAAPMSRDSVAVIAAEMRERGRSCGYELIRAWADRLAALTREAAPQASGGDELPCTDSDNCRRCSEDADTPHSGIPRGTLATTDSAHPQAAGSAPGEALSMSMFASRADYEAAAGSAPVGVEKDAARYRYARERLIRAAPGPDMGGLHHYCPTPDIYYLRGPTLDAAIDAALEKECAE